MMKKLTLLFAAILTVLLLPLSAFGENSTISSIRNADGSALLRNVTDSAGILSEDENSRLESQAEQTTSQYGVGVYIITLDNYSDSGYESAYEAASGMYKNYRLGAGNDRSGILLLLSMDNRKWAMFCYGKQSQYAFDSYGQEQLEDAFLDNFRENDWYGGFEKYLTTCNHFLAKAEAGHPARKSPKNYILFSLAIALITAAVAVWVMVSMMKNVGTKKNADRYTAGGFNLTVKEDRFLHRDVVRTKIRKDPPSDSGGGRVESGGGGTGRSGSF